MADFDFYIDIENSSGTKQGSGPLQSVSQWTYTARFDRAGTIAFTFAASDPQAQYVVNRNIARAYALLDGVWTEVGAGFIDRIETIPGNDGRVSLRASGLDLIGELGTRNVRSLEIGAGSGTTHSAALTAIGALAPAGWTFTPAASPANDYIYARYGGESVLGALVHLAERTQTHFYRSADRTLVFASAFTDSGIRAIQATGDLDETQCAIVSLKRSVDTHDLLTRIYPYGAGTGDTRLTLRATNRTAPTGYTLDKTNNYIENDDATTAYGLRDHPEIEWKDITTIANTSANRRGAANMLFDAALKELRRRSTLASQETYTLNVAGCSALLRPLQTLNLVYRDDAQNIDIDEDLYILEATWSMDTSGIYTTDLKVSTDDRWPDNDAMAAAERAAQGRVFIAHPQIGPNEWWENGTLYVGSNQADHIAEFPFVLSNAVQTIDQVLFRFKVTEPLSFTTIAAGAAIVSVDLGSATVTVGGTINIQHDHSVTIVDHSHQIPILDTSTPGSPSMEPLFFDITNDLFAVGVSGTDTFDYAGTTEDGGGDVITSADGGSTTLSLTGATGALSGSGTVDLSDAIHTSYGVYRSPSGYTYDIADLEFRVNGGVAGAWISMDTATAKTNGYYEFDITEYIQDSDTFGPLQEDNEIEIRRKNGAGDLAMEGVAGDGTRALVSTNPSDHNLAAGDEITISGNGDYDGTYIVDEVVNEYTFYILHAGTTIDYGGTLEYNKSAMILAKLGVRCSIQSIAFS